MVLLVLALFIPAAFLLCIGVAAIIDYSQWREDVIRHRAGTCRPGCRPCADARHPAAAGSSSVPGGSVHPRHRR